MKNLPHFRTTFDTRCEQCKEYVTTGEIVYKNKDGLWVCEKCI